MTIATTTATDTSSFRNLRITAIDITEILSDLGDRVLVRATLEDGSTRRLVDVPKGSVYLMSEGLVGRTFSGAYNQILCWLEGMPRIVEILKMGPIDEGNKDSQWEIVARLSDGTSHQAIVFFQDELRLTDADAKRFLNLSPSQAWDLFTEFDKERVPDGFNHADFSKLNICFVCGRQHR
jgi:hypothetical protein